MQSVNLTLRLSKKEKSTLQKLALINNTTMTDYIKSKVFDIEDTKKLLSNVLDKQEAKEEDKYNLEKVEEVINTSLIKSNNQTKKYLDLIAKIVLANNEILKETVCDKLTEHNMTSIRNKCETVLEHYTSDGDSNNSRR